MANIRVIYNADSIYWVCVFSGGNKYNDFCRLHIVLNPLIYCRIVNPVLCGEDIISALKHPILIQYIQSDRRHILGGHWYFIHDPLPRQKICSASQIGGEQLCAVFV